MDAEPDPDLILAIDTEPGGLDGLPRLKGPPYVPAATLGRVVDVLEQHEARIAALETPWGRRWLVRIKQAARSPWGQG